MIRNKRGQSRRTLHSAFEAGYDSVINGADLENCSFKWFGSVEGKENWERGRAFAKQSSPPHLNKGMK